MEEPNPTNWNTARYETFMFIFLEEQKKRKNTKGNSSNDSVIVPSFYLLFSNDIEGWFAPKLYYKELHGTE